MTARKVIESGLVQGLTIFGMRLRLCEIIEEWRDHGLDLDVLIAELEGARDMCRELQAEDRD